MTDLTLIWNDETGEADLALAAGDLTTDEGLASAVLISLFSDGRARPDDVLPDHSSSLGGGRRGWWADVLDPPGQSGIGSRLWLLGRSRASAQVVQSAREQAREALGWLVQDGAARAVEVDARDQDGALVLTIVITRPDASVARFQHVWSAL